MSLFRNNPPLQDPIGSGGGGIGTSGGGSGSSGGGAGSGGGGIGNGGGGIGSRFTLRATAMNLDGGAVPDPNLRRTDRDALHPAMRDAVTYLLRKFESDGLPFRLFEAFRTPHRQAWLYEQGRSRGGSIVTNAKPWQSFHQYGLAADFVLWMNNSWSWTTVGAYQSYWSRLHELGREVGLTPLSWERPHLQVAGLETAALLSGRFPDGGDNVWRDNLEAAIIGWSGDSQAPPLYALRPEVNQPE